MVSFTLAERFAKSPVKFAVGVFFVVCVLFEEVVRLNIKNSESESRHKIELSEKDRKHDGIVKIKDSLLYDCQQQSRLKDENQIKAKQLEAEEYRKLWVEVLAIKNGLTNKQR